MGSRVTEIRFYHLTRTSLERALAPMLGRTLERGQRAVVKTASAERAESLNAWLWSYEERGFLPHGSAKDGYAARQPIWLTDEDERPNEAEVLFLTEGTDSRCLPEYRLCAVLFDGNDENAVAVARDQWRTFKDAGYPLTYWQQDENGRWTEKSAAGQETGAG